MILVGQMLRSIADRIERARAAKRRLQRGAAAPCQERLADDPRPGLARQPGDRSRRFYEDLASRLDAPAKANELLRFGVR
jgi:hypothetical protein